MISLWMCKSLRSMPSPEMRMPKCQPCSVATCTSWEVMFRKGLEQDPRFTATLRGLGKTLVRRGRSAEAQREMQRREEQTPSNPQIGHYVIAKRLKNSGIFERTIVGEVLRCAPAIRCFSHPNKPLAWTTYADGVRVISMCPFPRPFALHRSPYRAGASGSPLMHERARLAEVPWSAAPVGRFIRTTGLPSARTSCFSLTAGRRSMVWLPVGDPSGSYRF